MKITSKTIAGLVIVGLMVLSLFGFVLSYQAPSQDQDYNGFTFTQTPQGWKTKVNDREHLFYFHPLELTEVNLPEAVRSLLVQPGLTITYNETSEAITLGELQYYVEQHLMETRVVRRATFGGAGTLPAVTCAESTPTSPVIVFSLQNESGITTAGSCVLLTGRTPAELVQIIDRSLYMLLGVMNG